MTDKVSPAVRSRIMQSVKSKNTQPEIAIRRLLTDLGYHYRLHYKKLPGSPDVVFIGKKKAIFVHGCFWHLHEGCSRCRIPPSQYWQSKLNNNKKRDTENIILLQNLGWSYLVIWECEISNDVSILKKKLVDFLENRFH